MNPIEAESAKRESPNPQPGREFESSERYVYLFGEAEQRTCDKCNGSGRQDCTVCNARGHIDCDCLEEPCLPDLPSESIYGKESCELCDGCTFCYTCRDCDGRQLVRCRLCSGTGQTNHVPQMLIKRTLLYNRQVLDTPEGLDESLVELAKGLPEPNGTAAVKIVEAQLRDMHSGMLRINKDEAMTHQLLQTQCIPIAKVLYKCKNDKQGTFWVIGVSGNFCYCPKLPWTTISSIITENE